MIDDWVDQRRNVPESMTAGQLYAFLKQVAPSPTPSSLLSSLVLSDVLLDLHSMRRQTSFHGENLDLDLLVHHAKESSAFIDFLAGADRAKLMRIRGISRVPTLVVEPRYRDFRQLWMSVCKGLPRPRVTIVGDARGRVATSLHMEPLVPTIVSTAPNMFEKQLIEGLKQGLAARDFNWTVVNATTKSILKLPESDIIYVSAQVRRENPAWILAALDAARVDSPNARIVFPTDHPGPTIFDAPAWLELKDVLFAPDPPSNPSFRIYRFAKP